MRKTVLGSRNCVYQGVNEFITTTGMLKRLASNIRLTGMGYLQHDMLR
jgi:hypothetical protein